MIALWRVPGLCLPQPSLQSRVDSGSRRVRSRHNVHNAILTETLAAINLVSQNIAVTSDPFPAAGVYSASSTRDTDFVSSRVKSFISACRDSGGDFARLSKLANVFPKLSKGFGLFSAQSPAFSAQSPFVSSFSDTSASDSTRLASSNPPAAVSNGRDPVSQSSQTQAPSHSQRHTQQQHALPDFVPYGHSASADAVAIDADAVSLPAKAATCKIARFLSPALKQLYMSPAALLKRSCDAGSRRVRRCFLVKDGHYPRLLQRMDSCGMLAWSTVAPEVVNGLFAVPKGDGGQRLIIDARRANALFADPACVALPSGELLGDCEAARGVPVFSGKADCADFYHCLEMPEQWWTFFGLPPVHPADVGLSHRFPDAQLIWPMVRTLPMGFAHAVLLAQDFHLGFIRECVPLLRDAARLSPENDLRLDRLRWMIYIDDLSVFGLSPDAVDAALIQYCAACDSVGLRVKPAKLQLASLVTEVIGLRFDGVALTVGVAPDKLAALIERTMGLVQSSAVLASDLASLLGKWAWAILPRRPAFSTLNSVYKWSLAFKGSRAPLWPSARLELAVLCALAPLLVADVAAAWFPDSVAFDASLSGQGVVAARLQPHLRDGLAAAAGLPPADAFRSDDVSDASLKRALSRAHRRSEFVPIHDQLQHQPWRTVVASGWRRPEHINALEATALRSAIRWLHSQPFAVNTRVLLLSDSAVVVSVTAKGRSSAPVLLSNCRRTTAFVLASGLRTIIRWLPSNLNPADAASRAF